MVRLIVGLGNPGEEYRETRHNAGFWFVDRLVGESSFGLDRKFHSARAQLASASDVGVLKPLQFMNRSGDAVAAYARYYKLAPDQILVAHDELDFPVGKVALKQGGGHGGHNGLRDIIAKLGSKDFYRLRIGIDHPGSRERVVGHVLGRMGAADRQVLEQALDRAVDVLPRLLSGDVSRAMSDLNK